METNFIRQYEDVISEDHCDALIRYFERKLNNNSVFVSKGNEDNGGGDNRVDQAIFLDRLSSDFSGLINQAVHDCWVKYVDEFKFLDKVSVTSYAQKMQKTPPMGGFHLWHWEHAGDYSNRNRVAVWTLYLTTHEDEGETEFLAHGLKVKPESGKFCIFPADYTAVHRGNPVYSKDKYIVTGWYEYN